MLLELVVKRQYQTPPPRFSKSLNVVRIRQTRHPILRTTRVSPLTHD